MTRALLLSLLLLVPVAGAADPDPEPPPADFKKLQGEWEIVSILVNGMKLPVPKTTTMNLKFTRDRLVVASGGMKTSNTWKCNPKKKPAHIDVTDAGTKQITLGIYKIDKDELTLLLAQPGVARPTSFDKPGSATTVNFKRKKK
jgi:uncharacterized protein (TIGR03067 family)